MTREELKSADTRSLISALQYCGRDSYYATYYDEVVDEITKRLNRIAELEAENERLKGDLELWESGACRATNLDKCGVVKELEAQIEKMKCCANCKYEEQGYMIEPCKSCNRYFPTLKVGARDKWEMGDGRWEIKEK